jgi:hypothetical protein
VTRAPSTVERMRARGFTWHGGRSEPEPPPAVTLESRGAILARQLRLAAAKGLIPDPVSRTEHAPVPGLTAGGSTPGRTFSERVRNLTVRVFGREEANAELDSYVDPGRAAAEAAPVDATFGLPSRDAEAELRGYVWDGGDAA